MFGNDIVITSSGGTKNITPTIPATNQYRITTSGTVTLAAPLVIQYDPSYTPEKWDTIILYDEASIIISASTVTVFGQLLTAGQCLGKGMIVCVFNGTTWDVKLFASVVDKTTGITEATRTTITNTPSTITLNRDSTNSVLSLVGSPTLSNSLSVVQGGAPKSGDMMICLYNATATVGVNTITIFGKLLSTAQAKAGNSIVISVYDGTAWQTILLDPTPSSVSFVAGTFTKSQADAAIAASSLEIGGFYDITNVHPTLFDDGTTSGTHITLQAVAANKFSNKGIGKFWNPKYNQAVSGFGIWSNRSSWTATPVSLVFDANEAITADNGATGYLVGVLADNLFIATAGNWAAATSITGDVTGATATLAGITLKSYVIGQKVIWGHYVWENVNGNVGAATDVLTLDAEWLKLPYTSTDYNLAYDEIEYDYTNNWITSRYESGSDNRVVETYATFGDSAYTYHSIAVFQWGNHYNASSGKGIGGNKVDESYAEFCNFQGLSVINNTIATSSYIKDNLFIGTSFVNNNILNVGSAFYSNTLSGTSAFYSNSLIASYFYSNTLNNSNVSLNTLDDSPIHSNVLISNNFIFIIAKKATITIGSTEVATFYPILAANYTKNIISTVDAKNVLITWSVIGVSTPLDLATGVTPV